MPIKFVRSGWVFFFLSLQEVADESVVFQVSFFFISSVRTARLQVRFLRPLEDDGGKDFFNVFVLHQVRKEHAMRRYRVKPGVSVG